MWKSSKLVFTGLLTMVVLVMGVLGCSGVVSEVIRAQNRDEFITDLAVEVRIVKTDVDWAVNQSDTIDSCVYSY
jgi:hypothetical protein